MPGVRVVTSFGNLDMAVVRGDAAAMSRLVRTHGVRGLAPDDAVSLTSKGDVKGTDAVFASEGLGGAAGKAGAGAGVRVAVIDTGVSDTPALNRASGRLVDGADASQIADGQYGQAAEGGTYSDGFGHGTFLANIIAGGTVPGVNKPIGVAPGATVVVVRVARPDGTSSLSKVLGAMDWVIGHRDSIDVANLSLSHQRPNDAYGADPLTDAVQQVRAAGVSIVVSSGNTAGTVGDPGFTPQALTVGAADLDTKKVAAFSGSDVVKGVQKPDVVANGVHVMGILPRGLGARELRWHRPPRQRPLPRVRHQPGRRRHLWCRGDLPRRQPWCLACAGQGVAALRCQGPQGQHHRRRRPDQHDDQGLR